MSLPREWPWAVQFLELHPQIWSRYYTLPQLFNEIFAERLQLWLGRPLDDDEPFACAVTTLDQYPLVRELRFILLAGNGERTDYLRYQDDFRSYVENWAAAQGATYAGVKGRKAWGPILAPHGYEFDGVYLRKSLIKGHVN